MLEEIRKLPDNWNGNGTPAFSKIMLDRCENIAKSLPVKPDIYPTAAGSIQMEYEKSSGEYMEFEVFIDHTEIFCIDKEGKEKEYFLLDREKECSALCFLVEKFYKD